MDRAELQTFADRYIETWQGRDPAALARYHAADCVVESPMYQTRRGRAAIEEAYRAFFTSFPDATTQIDAVLIDPPRLALFTFIQATHVNEFFGLPGTNRHIEFRNARLFEIEGGLIKHERRIYDFTGILVKVGVLRALPAKP
jgi:steroid delta-isomerase-like uncharacterized protein